MSSFQIHIEGDIWDKKRILSLDNTNLNQYPLAIQLCYEWYLSNASPTIQTSGSTGYPKTIQLDRKAIAASVQRTARFFNLSAQSTFLVVLPLDKIAGRMQLYRALCLEATVYVNTPSRSLNDVLSLPYDFVSLSTLQIRHLVQDERGIALLSDCRIVLIGGAAPDESTIQRLQVLPHTEVYLSYGMTETLSHIAIQALHPIREPGFRLLDGVEWRATRHSTMITDRLLGIEIETTDSLEALSDSYFVYKGRRDRVINSGGVKVHPELIETIVQQWFIEQGWTNLFYVGSLPHPALGEQVVLYIDALPVEKNSLLEGIKQRVPPYHAPREVIVQTIQVSENGKIRYKEEG
ncbi:MAG: AMP-binding protein [Cytophagaceae bacterium]|jgi:O-succinylbenzoic acid--CoA ligase|nr:AMP-binding protein [Cytophagaceae bacterium]